MTIKMIWTYIKADRFFAKYCPAIKSYKHKIRGTDGNKKPIEFTLDEMKQIKRGLKELFKDIT